MILILYNSSINNKLISRDLRFRRHIGCFCSISAQRNIPNTATALFCVSEQHDGDSFLNESTLNDSVQSQRLSDLLPPAGGFSFTFKVSFHFLNNFKYQYLTFHV